MDEDLFDGSYYLKMSMRWLIYFKIYFQFLAVLNGDLENVERLAGVGFEKIYDDGYQPIHTGSIIIIIISCAIW